MYCPGLGASSPTRGCVATLPLPDSSILAGAEAFVSRAGNTEFAGAASIALKRWALEKRPAAESAGPPVGRASASAILRRGFRESAELSPATVGLSGELSAGASEFDSAG